MTKIREAFADALARVLFDKPLAGLDRTERAERNFIRALEARANEDRYDRPAVERPEDLRDPEMARARKSLEGLSSIEA